MHDPIPAFSRQIPKNSARARAGDTLGKEMRLTLRLGAPLALGELGWMSTYIVDALMVGRLPDSPLAISASSLGNTIYYAIVFAVIFLMNGVETLTAQAYGQGRPQESLRVLAQSFWIVAVGTPLTMLATLGALRLLPWFGTPAAIAAETARYLHPLVWSTAPLLAYMALRRYLQSMDRVVLVALSLITASAVNWLGDWAFLFGHLGAKPMGIAGSAYATCVVRVYMLALLAPGVWLVRRRLGQRIGWSLLRPHLPTLRALLRIGWPSALEELEELGVSTYMSIVCAKLGAVLLAAHQVVLDLNAFVYQVPAGLSYATVVRVGQAAGRRQPEQVRRATRASLLLGVGFMLGAATVFAVFARFWAGLYTNSPAVVTAAAPIFTLCAFLLVGDTIFTLLASALTGLGDTRTPMLVSIACNWCLGMPLSFWLAFHAGFRLEGLWAGRAAGSVTGALVLLVLWQMRVRRNALTASPAAAAA